MADKPTKAELQAKHGTPQEFAAAVNRAADDLFITTEEAEAGIKKYQDEWNAADPHD